jgi:hypothetical protein
MASNVKSAPANESGGSGLLIFLICIFGLLIVLFGQTFQHGMVVFSNDGPLGPVSADNAKMPGIFKAYWADLNWLGGASPTAAPNVTALLLWLGGPLGYAKFFAPLTIILLGLAGWFFFRQSGHRSVVCILGGLATALNSDFFSYACWGLGSLALAVAAFFVCLGILIRSATRPWIKAALAGMALGFALMWKVMTMERFSACTSPHL